MATIAVALPGEITQKDKIEKMVKKRRLNFDYISRLHAGGGGADELISIGIGRLAARVLTLLRLQQTLIWPY